MLAKHENFNFGKNTFFKRTLNLKMRTAHPNELRFGTQLKSLEIHLPNMKKIG